MPICPNCGSYVDEGSPMCSCGTSMGVSRYDEPEIYEDDNLTELADNCIRIARDYERHGRYAEAVSEYEKALHYNYSSSTLFKMGEALMQLGRYYRALECFEDCNQSDDVIKARCEALIELGRCDEAIEILFDWIDKIRNRSLHLPSYDPDNADDVNYYNKVKYKKELERNKLLARAYNTLGWAYHMKNDEKTAIKYFEEGILYDYDYANNWNCKAIALNLSGKYVEALKFYDIALGLDKGDKVITKNRRECLEDYAREYKSGNYTQKSKYLKEAFEVIGESFTV